MDKCVYCSNDLDDEYDREETVEGPMHESCYIDYRDEAFLDSTDYGDEFDEEDEDWNG